MFKVVEVKINTDKATELLSAVTQSVGKPGVIESVLATSTNYWRDFEYKTSKGEEVKMNKAFEYASADITYIQDAITRGQQSALVPRLNLLVQSLERIRAQAEKVPIEYLADIKEKSRTTFSDANDLIAQVKEKEIDISTVEEKLAKVVSGVEGQLGPLEATSVPAVAGTSNSKEEEATTTPSPTPTVAPLRF